MIPKQYVCVVPFGWDKPVFGQIKKLDENQPHLHVLVYVDRLWGANHHLKQFENNPQLKGIDLTCSIKEVVELDWTTYWNQVKNHDMSDHDVMEQTYQAVGMELSWKHTEDPEYDDRLKQKKVHAKIAAFKPKPAAPFAKNDIVTVSNVHGYPGKKFRMIIAAVGPGHIEKGAMIRGLVFNGMTLTLPASYDGELGRTHALAFYLNGFPQKLIFDIVQWNRTGHRNFIKKSEALDLLEPIDMSDEAVEAYSSKVQSLTEQQQRNQQDSKFHKNDILYMPTSTDVGRGGYDDAPNYDYFVLAVVGPGSYPNGVGVVDVLVNGKLLPLRVDYKGKLTRTEGIAFYTEGTYTNPRWIKCNWRKADTWNRLYKKRTEGGIMPSVPIRF